MLVTAALVVSGCARSDDDPGDAVQAAPVGLNPPLHARGGDPSGGRPGITRLDPDLLAAVRSAARAARDDGIRLVVTSGWRSREHQQRLLDEAVGKYGSEQEALRWVATPDDSAHVTGDAVDVGPTDAMDWLGRRGSAYGLCQTFANEPWHFELATDPGGECPEMYADGSER